LVFYISNGKISSTGILGSSSIILIAKSLMLSIKASNSSFFLVEESFNFSISAKKYGSD
jgi:hypothetical protein